MSPGGNWRLRSPGDAESTIIMSPGVLIRAFWPEPCGWMDGLSAFPAVKPCRKENNTRETNEKPTQNPQQEKIRPAPNLKTKVSACHNDRTSQGPPAPTQGSLECFSSRGLEPGPDSRAPATTSPAHPSPDPRAPSPPLFLVFDVFRVFRMGEARKAQPTQDETRLRWQRLRANPHLHQEIFSRPGA